MPEELLEADVNPAAAAAPPKKVSWEQATRAPKVSWDVATRGQRVAGSEDLVVPGFPMRGNVDLPTEQPQRRGEGARQQLASYDVLMESMGARDPIISPFTELSQEEQKALRLSTPQEQLEAGLAEGSAHAINSLFTPENVTLMAGTMGLGAVPVLGRALALGFAYSMLKDFPDQAIELGTEMGKPKGARDYQKVGQLVTEGAFNTGFGVMAAAHGIGPRRPGGPGPAAARLLGEQVRRARGVGMEEAAAMGGAGIEETGRMPDPENLVTLDQFFTEAKAAQTREEAAGALKNMVLRRAASDRLKQEQEAQRLRPQYERERQRANVAVPETPAEPQRNLSVIEEIRANNARTKQQVQDLFKARGLSREEAGQLRDLAWGPSEEQGVTAKNAENAKKTVSWEQATGKGTSDQQERAPVSGAESQGAQPGDVQEQAGGEEAAPAGGVLQTHGAEPAEVLRPQDKAKLRELFTKAIEKGSQVNADSAEEVGLTKPEGWIEHKDETTGSRRWFPPQPPERPGIALGRQYRDLVKRIKAAKDLDELSDLKEEMDKFAPGLDPEDAEMLYDQHERMVAKMLAPPKGGKGKPEPVPKPIWEMTREEFLGKPKGHDAKAAAEYLDKANAHEAAVEQALLAGETVPREVLDDYSPLDNFPKIKAAQIEDMTRLNNKQAKDKYGVTLAELKGKQVGTKGQGPEATKARAQAEAISKRWRQFFVKKAKAAEGPNELAALEQQITDTAHLLEHPDAVMVRSAMNDQAAKLEQLAKGMEKQHTPTPEQKPKPKPGPKAEKAAEEKLLADAQKVVDSRPRSGTEGGPSAKEVKADLVGRIRAELVKLVEDDNVKLTRNADGGYAAQGDGGGIAFGEVTEKTGGKVQVTIREAGDKKGAHKVSATVENLAEAELMIKAMAARRSGRAIIAVPGDGIYQLNRTGNTMLGVWRDARLLETGKGEAGIRSNAPAAERPPAQIKTEQDWRDAKEFHGLEPDNKIAEFSNALAEFARKVKPEDPDSLTTKQVDDWVKERMKTGSSREKAQEPQKGTEPETAEMAPPSSQGEVGKARPGAGQGASEGQNLPTEEEMAFPSTRTMGRTETVLRGQEQSAEPGLEGASIELAQTVKQGPGLTAKNAQNAKTGTAAAPTAGAKPKWFQGLRRVFASASVDEDAQMMGGILRAAMGAENAALARADAALNQYRFYFDKRPVGRNWQYNPNVPLPLNYQMIERVESGDLAGLTEVERRFVTSMRQLLDEGVDAVHAVSPESLRDLITNYFPRLWKDPVKNRDKIAALVSKRPWEGSKAFLRKRTLEYFTDGLAEGLRPANDNPVDMVMSKLGEMHRFVAARTAIEEAKARGQYRFFYVFEKKLANWVRVEDPTSTQWAPPHVTVKEAFDAQVRAKTLELMDWLGIEHRRSAAIGGRRWGYAVAPGGGQTVSAGGTGKPSYSSGYVRPKIVTKFGGPDFVMWHEIGHQVDWLYPDLRDQFKGKKMQDELRALADARAANVPKISKGFKDYLHKEVEKMANLLDAHVRAPALFEKLAPTVRAAYLKWMDLHPDLRDKINAIQPSLTLESASTQQKLAGPVKLGDWMMPAGAAGVVQNYLAPGLGKYKAFRGLRDVAGLQNGIQLAGFFHGSVVFKDAWYSSVGLTAYDLMKAGGRVALDQDLPDAARLLARAGREAALSATVVGPAIDSFIRGRRIYQATREPGSMGPKADFIARLAQEANLRAGHSNYDAQFARRWRANFFEAVKAPSIGAAWDVFWRTPFAALQLTVMPVLQYLVPRMKMGIFARMAERVMADNPRMGKEQMRRLLAQAADATEDRLGQVTYDNLFQHRAVKDIGQLTFRAYGWQLTKYRMILGAGVDWGKAGAALVRGERPNLTFRMTYLPAMIAGHAAIGAAVQYLLTGKPPKELQDYLFPESGLIDEYGRPIRIAIADFVKDMVNDWKSFPNLRKMGAEWTRKLSPLWNTAAEMMRNQDFYGTEIFSPGQLGEPALEHLLKNLGEGAQYFATGNRPFSVQAGQRIAQAGGGPGLQVAPWFGFTPAPRYAILSPAEERASEIMRGLSPQGSRSKEQSQHAQLLGQLVRDVRSGKVGDDGEFAKRAGAAKVKDQAELTRLKERILWTPLQYQIWHMPVDKAMEVWDLANEKEKLSLAAGIAEKIDRAYKRGGMEDDKARRYVQMVEPYWRRAREGKATNGNR
jgi:hypothetical protein